MVTRPARSINARYSARKASRIKKRPTRVPGRINRLGGRSRQEKWILQSELFNELHKLVQSHHRTVKSRFGGRSDRLYALVRDYLAGVRDSMREVWGQPR